MIPTTVVTGQLGAGKTTITLNLIKQMDPNYKVMWLKNEYGDVNIDSELAKTSNIQTTEILNGCLCCVLVGKLHEALEEIVKKYELDRLIIETAGTAYPFPIVNEITQVEGINLDSLVNVIDVLNFEKFKDRGFLAKEQANYFDLLVLNKHELVDEDTLYQVEEDINEIYFENPKVKSQQGFVDKDLIIGIDKNNFNKYDHKQHTHHHDEIESFSFHTEHKIDKDKLISMLNKLDKDEFYRIKGIINTGSKFEILNYVFGKVQFSEIEGYNDESKITFMGKGIEVQKEMVQESFKDVIV